jgi:hypothetical protein
MRRLVLILMVMCLTAVSAIALIRTAGSAAADPTAELILFRAEPETVSRGGQITLFWNVPGSETVTIQQRYGNYRTGPQRVYARLSAEGSLTVDLSSLDVDAPPNIHTVDFWLLTPSESDSA